MDGQALFDGSSRAGSCGGADGRAQAEGDFGEAPRLASGTHQGRGLHVARAGRRTLRARAEGRLPVSVGVRPRRKSELQKKASWPANATVLTSPAGARNGRSIRARSILNAWSLSTRPGPRPTWQPCGVGRRAAPG